MIPDRRRKLIGLGFALVPIAMFTVFAIGEAGEVGGWWGHLIQVAAALLALGVAWRWPRIGGPVLLFIGAVLSVLMLLEGGESVSTKLLTVGLFFAPLFVAGVFFSLAAWGTAQRSGRGPEQPASRSIRR